MDDRFFAAVFLPKDNTQIKVETIKDDVPPAPAGKEEMRVGVEVGGDSVNRFACLWDRKIWTCCAAWIPSSRN